MFPLRLRFSVYLHGKPHQTVNFEASIKGALFRWISNLTPLVQLQKFWLSVSPWQKFSMLLKRWPLTAQICLFPLQRPYQTLNPSLLPLQKNKNKKPSESNVMWFWERLFKISAAVTSLTSVRGVSLGQMTRNGFETVFLTPILVQVVYFTFMHTVEF